jgi:hypothetical protein
MTSRRRTVSSAAIWPGSPAGERGARVRELPQGVVVRGAGNHPHREHDQLGLERDVVAEEPALHRHR